MAERYRPFDYRQMYGTLTESPPPTQYEMARGCLCNALWHVWNIAWHLGSALGFTMLCVALIRGFGAASGLK